MQINSSFQPMQPVAPTPPPEGNIENRQPPQKPQKPDIQNQISNMSEEEQKSFFNTIENMSDTQRAEFGKTINEIKDNFSSMSSDDISKTILSVAKEISNSQANTNSSYSNGVFINSYA